MATSEQETNPQRTPPALGGDALIPLMACGLAAYYFMSTTELVWEAKATGIVVGLILLALCAVQAVRVGLRIVSGGGSLSMASLRGEPHFDRQRLGLVAMVALYVATIHWVGATVGLFFLLVGSMRLLGVTRPRTLFAVAFVSAAFVHLTLIVLLDSRLPKGWLIETLTSALSGA